MELWTPEHAKTLLPAVALMLVIGVVLRHAIGKKDIKLRLLPLRIIAVALLVLEVGKQLTSALAGYDLYMLPFHFCSLALLVLPMAAFYNGKHAHAVGSICTAVCAAISLLTMIYPNLIYSAGNITGYFEGYLNFHTVTFHNLVLFAFILILALDLHTPGGKKTTKPLVWFTVCFCAVSSFMATVLKTNYANYYQCNIPPLEEIRISLQSVLGVWITQLLYICIVSALTVLFVLLSYWVYCLLQHALCKTAVHAQ